MTDTNITYQTALETTANTYPPSVGFQDPTSVNLVGNQVLISQNNTIIELLIQIIQKLDKLDQVQQPSPSNFQSHLDQINKQIESLFVTSKKFIPKSSQQLVVWTDPRTLLPKTKGKEPDKLDQVQ